MLNSLPVRLLWHSLNWLTRIAIVASGVLAVLMAIIIIVSRYWLMPDVGQYHDRIVASLSTAIGSPVTIDKIEGDWRGLRPRLNLSGVRILDERRQVALELPGIGTSVSWLSLFTGELRLASLEIERPELLIRRDAQGKFYVGGVALSSQGSDNDLSDWLLRQSRMVVRDAHIVWVDEQREAPLLELKHVNLRIESFLGKHRFALQAQPPEDLSTPIDVRGDFKGETFDDLDAWRGQIYTRVDNTDVTAWRPWLDLPSEFSRGRGALRGWLSIAHGGVNEITADLELRDVVTRLAEDLPELSLRNLRGRAAWKTDKDGLEVSTRKLSMRLHSGIVLPPTDFYLRLAGNGRGGEIQANLLQLETLSSLASFVPLDAGLRAQLAAYEPRGKVANLNVSWQGDSARPQRYSIKGSFDDLALRQVGAFPGFSGLSVDVDGNETSGLLNIDSRHLMVDAPTALVEPLDFATLTGQASWQQKDGELLLRADNVAVNNADLAGNLHGSYQTKKGTLGLLDLTIALTRGDVTKSFRYIPLVALDKEDNDWVKGALRSGHTEDFRVRVKGNLSDFPLHGTEDALLEIGGHAQGVELEFHKDWPHVDNIAGEFWIRGNKLEVKAEQATMLGAQLHKLSVALPDLMSEDLPLEVKGVAQASNDIFLDFIQKSPVRGYIDGFTDDMKASGNSQLGLSLRVPLLGEKPVKVDGTLRVAGIDIDLGGGAPLLRNTHGMLTFTESGIKAENVASEILGGKARIDVNSGEGGVLHARAQGRCDLDALRKDNPNPMLDRLRGGAVWNADIKVVKRFTEMLITSDLRGITSTLPVPFAKRSSEAMPLRLEKKIVTEGQDAIEFQLGKLLSARLARRDENGAMTIKRGVVSLGAQADTGKWMKREGVWLVGQLPQLSLEGWGGLLGNAGGAADMPVTGADFTIGRVSGFGMQVNDLGVEASRRGEGLTANLSSRALNGELEWQPRGDGKLTVHLQSVVWERGNQVPAAAKAAPVRSSPASPSNLPAMQIAVDNLKVDGKQIGRFELVGHPDGADWRLRRFSLVNPDGSLVGDGVWHGGERNGRTEANLQLQISDAGKILARSGYPDTVKGGSGKLQANFSWAGAPHEFNYAALVGSLKLDTGKGQFLKMDPGIGKLLSVLSLQSLPKRVALDFGDVFSEGFQFDSINGNASIRNGMIETQDFHIDGSSAKVTMKGRVDLNQETQDLRVEVLPTLGDSVSLIGAFAAGPAVGLGALIVNKVLGNPLDKLASFEYNVSGTWANPTVVKVGQKPVKTDNQNE